MRRCERMPFTCRRWLSTPIPGRSSLQREACAKGHVESRRRIKRNPAVLRKVHLNPGMGVRIRHYIGVGSCLIGMRNGKPCHPTRGYTQRAQHDGQGTRKVVTVSTM